jgi:hypothetical protein
MNERSFTKRTHGRQAQKDRHDRHGARTTLPMKLATLLLLSACAVDDPELGIEVEEIQGLGVTNANQWQRDRAFVRSNGCTATRISSRFAITAAHCQSSTADDLWPYAGGPGVEPYAYADITQVINRPGVIQSSCNDHSDNCWDDSGWFADIALLRLEAPDEDHLEGPAAVLEWRYPGSGHGGEKVGAGRHGHEDNPARVLKQIFGVTDFSPNAANGEFFSTITSTNKGDSGGPFYIDGRIAGTLWGIRDGRDRYTNVARHLHWILQNIGFTWRGQPPQSSLGFIGTQLQAFDGSELVCQYACENTAACEAYAVASNTCRLYDNASVVGAASSSRGAFKWGTRSGNSGTVVGYARSSSASVVQNVSTDGRIDELGLTSSGWSDLDIHGSAPTVSGKISALVRADGTSAVYFRSTTNRLFEIARVGGVWQSYDITGTGEAPGSNPVAYIKADGVTAVVYRGATTNHIIERRLGSKGWLTTDLSVASGSNVAASSDPSASVRSDGYSAVTFRAGTQIWELFQAPGGSWGWGVPSQLANAPSAASRPFGFTHSDGTNAIVYRSVADHIIQLRLTSSGWVDTTLAGGATLDPTAYVRTDGVESIVFRSTSNQLMEITQVNNSWSLWNLTTGTGGPTLNSSPSVYLRHDGNNVVLGKSAAQHVYEHAYFRGGLWNDYDLTAGTGETP